MLPSERAAEQRGRAAPIQSPLPPWPGRATAFRIEAAGDACGDPCFDRRLVLPERARGGWIVLSYADDPLASPARPVLRVLRGPAGEAQDFVLPGAGHGLAHWLGLIPSDVREIRLAAGPGFVLERAAVRTGAGVLLQCLLRRPWRFVAALNARARGFERGYRDILRGTCAVTPFARFPAWAAARSRPSSPPAATLRIRCLVLAPAGAQAAVARSLEALARQTHPPAGILVAWDSEPPSDAPQTLVLHRAWDSAWRPADLLAGADALCSLEAGDAPTPDALALLAAGLGGAGMAYGDSVAADGRPWLKPDWSPDLALAAGYVGSPRLVAAAAVARMPDRSLGPLSGAATALDIAAATACGRAIHVPRILARTGAAPSDPAARAAALDRHLTAAGAPARAIVRAGAVDLAWPLPDPPPRASIVIPSRDRLDLIARVCRGVLTETAYPDIELIVVDNGSTDRAVLDHYATIRADPRVKILAYPQPFNFAAMVNAGVEAAAGTVVVLLNNDVVVLEPGWLEAMVRQAIRPEVGAVGARLLYGSGRLQHAGVVVGLGGRAGHILRRRPGDAPGHLGQMRVAHEVSAVTAACLAVRREAYRSVGGFDADAFPVDFNDVDFCLRLGAAGLKTVWTPAATLAHLESVSRGPSVGEKRARFEREAARFSERWRPAIRHDPFYHPALTLTTFGEDLE